MRKMVEMISYDITQFKHKKTLLKVNCKTNFQFAKAISGIFLFAKQNSISAFLKQR